VLPTGKGLLAMMRIYLDRGEKTISDKGVMTVGTVVFKPVSYKQFVRPWVRMLKPWGAKAFHATDFYCGYDEFKRDTPRRKALFEDDSRRIPGLIAPHIEKALAVAFRPDEVLPLLSDRWKESFGTSLHAMSVQLALILLGWWAKEIRYHDGFAAFAEGGDPDSGYVDLVVNNMRRDPVAAPHIQLKTFTTVTERGLIRGIEAADFFAWHWNQHYLHRDRIGKGDRPRKDYEAFARMAGDKAQETFLTGWKLKHFLELGDEHIRLTEG